MQISPGRVQVSRRVIFLNDHRLEPDFIEIIGSFFHGVRLTSQAGDGFESGVSASFIRPQSDFQRSFDGEVTFPITKHAILDCHIMVPRRFVEKFEQNHTRVAIDFERWHYETFKPSHRESIGVSVMR